MDVPAKSCNWDNQYDDKTQITILTPNQHNFKESEIPITITTEGMDNEGITLPNLAQRMLFHIYMYNDRNPIEPTEVHF
jgi:hypothetical protein